MRICPVCGKSYSDYPALSRRDNKTEICPECGMQEALDDFYGFRDFRGIEKEGDTDVGI